MQSEIEALTMRVARLERANRRMKLIIVTVLLLALVGIASMGFAGKARTIEAEKIVILDAHGRARVTIWSPGDEPGIVLSDENGTERTFLTSHGLYLASNSGKQLVGLGMGPPRSGLIFNGSDGKPLVVLSGLPHPRLGFYGPDGKLSWSAP